ncbi:MAG: sodium:alanine symporter family protein [Rickettsiaceae bacterium]|nr:sodium:alanine symporter family protein [Rickettsiaceae bacterium]
MSIIDNLFNYINIFQEFYWNYVGWLLICFTGIYLTIKSRGLQFRALYNFRKNIKEIFADGKGKEGMHPLKLYFASVGGMVGIGNIVGISVALMIGGPGSIFWTIIASIFGTLLKYSEIYLGVKHRVKNKYGGLDGGPMYYLQDAFKSKFIASLFAVFLCIYGAEVYQFVILVDRIESSFTFDRHLVVFGLLMAVIYSAFGGINRIANICSVIMPVFMISYVIMSIYIIIQNADYLPEFLGLVVKSAFTKQAGIGGFLGSSMIVAMHYGMSKAVYSGDIGIGYDSIVQSETRVTDPTKQATFAIYSLFTDTFICIITNLMLGVTGAWYKLQDLQTIDIVPATFSNYFPYSDIFVTLLLFFAGFTTVIGFLAVGIKCARFLSPKYGKIIYLIYAPISFIFCSNFSPDKLFIIMDFVSGILVLLSIAGILKLRKEIKFN